MKKKLRLKAFRAWLESMPADEVIGRRGSPLECPIANYLKTTIRQDVVISYGRAYHGPYACVLPRWAQRFVRLIHAPVRANPDIWGSEVTAREALDVLKHCRKRR